MQLDQIKQMWTEYNDPNSMHAEEAGWQSLLKRIATSPQLLSTARAALRNKVTAQN